MLDTELFTMLVLRPSSPRSSPSRSSASSTRIACFNGTSPLPSAGLDEAAFRTLVAADDLEEAEPLVGIGLAIVGDQRPSNLVISNFASQRGVEVGSGMISDIAGAMEAGAKLENLAHGRGVDARCASAVQ